MESKNQLEHKLSELSTKWGKTLEELKSFICAKKEKEDIECFYINGKGIEKEVFDNEMKEKGVMLVVDFFNDHRLLEMGRNLILDSHFYICQSLEENYLRRLGTGNELSQIVNLYDVLCERTDVFPLGYEGSMERFQCKKGDYPTISLDPKTNTTIEVDGPAYNMIIGAEILLQRQFAKSADWWHSTCGPDFIMANEPPCLDVYPPEKVERLQRAKTQPNAIQTICAKAHVSEDTYLCAIPYTHTGSGAILVRKLMSLLKQIDFVCGKLQLESLVYSFTQKLIFEMKQHSVVTNNGSLLVMAPGTLYFRGSDLDRYDPDMYETLEPTGGFTLDFSMYIPMSRPLESLYTAILASRGFVRTYSSELDSPREYKEDYKLFVEKMGSSIFTDKLNNALPNPYNRRFLMPVSQEKYLLNL